MCLSLDIVKAEKRGSLNLITAQRQLEEIRLIMTAQANYSLLKQGISIETEPLADLVEQLKELENSYYRHLLSSESIDASEENVSLFKEITKQVTEIKYVPAYVLGMKEADVSTYCTHRTSPCATGTPQKEHHLLLS